METSNSYPIFSFNFLKALIIHMRPYLLFVSSAAGLAGMAIGWQSDKSLFNFLFIFLPFFLGYGFGQALTDCFQIDTDSISAPYRPLVKREITPKSLAIVSTIGLVLIAIPIVLYNPANVIFCLLSIVGLATYTYFKKKFWMAGPFYNGWIVMLLPIMGFLAVSEQGISSLLDINVLLVCGTTLFSYANFVLIGYLKDISADKKTNYRTFPVVFGWIKTVWLGNLFLLIVLVFGYFILDFHNKISTGTFLLASIIAVSGQLTALLTKNKSEENTSYAIAATVRAFILWHISIVLLYQLQWAVFALIFYATFEVVLILRPAKTQI